MIERQLSHSESIQTKNSLANFLDACSRALSRAFSTAWWWLRQVTGDAAYDNYLRHHLLHSPTLTRTQFYRDSLRREYSTINRCC